MLDADVIIIGGGPAGLTAGLYLSRARRRVILLERESFGGQPKNVEWIENYPGFPNGVSGPQLASDMITQATKYGLKLEQTEATGIELYSGCKWVTCEGGLGYTTSVVIIAGGAKPKKLHVPGEKELEGKGVFACGLCDGGKYVDQAVLVCGGGDAGVTEALYMSRLANRVILIEAAPNLTAATVLQERAAAEPKLEIRCSTKVEAIIGKSRVEAVDLAEAGSDRRECVKIAGVLVHVGIESNAAYLRGTVPMDNEGQIIVNGRMETEIPHILAAGDIRCGSPRQIVTAVGDGAIAAISAERLLQMLT
jgi:thioredoxin reductase (NADPH)